MSGTVITAYINANVSVRRVSPAEPRMMVGASNNSNAGRLRINCITSVSGCSERGSEKSLSEAMREAVD